VADDDQGSRTGGADPWSVVRPVRHHGRVDAMHPRGRSDLSGQVTVRRTATTTVLSLTGEIDAAVVSDFETEHGTPEPVDAIDADGVTFLSVHAAELIAQWARVSAAAGREGALRRPSRQVRRLLELTGLDGELAIPPPRAAPPG